MKRSLTWMMMALLAVPTSALWTAHVRAAAPMTEVSSSGDKTARGIFYEEEGPAQTGLAIRFRILLSRPGAAEPQFVRDDFSFKTGDRVRLIVEANCRGYLYIINKGPGGRGVQLFPDARINGGENFLEAHTETVIPNNGSFVFDNEPGIEEVYVFFSPKKIDDLVGLTAVRPASGSRASGPVMLDGFEKVKDKLLARKITKSRAKQSRDIVFVEESPVPVAPPVFMPPPPVVVNPMVGVVPPPPGVLPPPPKICPVDMYHAVVGDGILIKTIQLVHNDR